MRTVAGVRPDRGVEWAVMKAVASKLASGTTEKLCKRVRQDRVDSGARPGTTSEEPAGLKQLKKENAGMKRAKGIIETAALSSRPSPAGRTRARGFHRHHRNRSGGVEPICRVLSAHDCRIPSGW
ncbi:hypothetical protein [Streptomyces sp. NPDC093071]|uniref:hypothetical protein n=1 Tax=Streptomyces sp. NPDC093071 TaxID=3366022 RepID=UPI00382B1AE9